MENLDFACAEFGRQLAANGIQEKILTDTLVVLEEKGVYAAFLFVKARGETALLNLFSDFLRGTPSGAQLLGNGDPFNALQKLAEDLDRLLFAQDLLRQSIIYGRYHVKARRAAGGGK